MSPRRLASRPIRFSVALAQPWVQLEQRASLRLSLMESESLECATTFNARTQQIRAKQKGLLAGKRLAWHFENAYVLHFEAAVSLGVSLRIPGIWMSRLPTRLELLLLSKIDDRQLLSHSNPEF